MSVGAAPVALAWAPRAPALAAALQRPLGACPLPAGGAGEQTGRC